MDGLSAPTVAELTAEEVARALTRSFEGYLTGPVSISARDYERRFRAENLDPFASRVYHQDGSPVGVLLVARRGWTSRIAATGVLPEMRGRGLGRSIVAGALEEASARGDRSVSLEVFERNAPALGLYEGLGFRARRRLVGYRREPDGTVLEGSETLEELDPLEVARLVAREGEPDLPWMLSAETLSATTPPARAWHLDGRAYAVVEDSGRETLLLKALIVRRSERRKGFGSRLLRALQKEYPGQTLLVPEILPEGPASAFFAGLGWRPEPLSQLEMYLPRP